MTPSRDNLPSPLPRSTHVPLPITHPHAAGIDIGAAEHWVAVSPACTAQPVRRFGACTVDLEAIAAWLQACGVTTVAMESTGVYWIPLFELLESRGFQVLLVDPRQVPRAPGRPKRAAHDCQWLQRLHTSGLLPARRPGLRAARLPAAAADAHHVGGPAHPAHAAGPRTAAHQAHRGGQ
jgi:transposase